MVSILEKYVIKMKMRSGKFCVLIVSWLNAGWEQVGSH